MGIGDVSNNTFWRSVWLKICGRGGQAQEATAEEEEEVEADGGTPASAAGATPAEAKTASPEEATSVAAAANGDVKMVDAPTLQVSMPLQLHKCQYRLIQIVCA